MNPPSNHQPPRIANWILRSVKNYAYLDCILGDLEEIYEEKAGVSPIRAKIWYVGELVLTVFNLLMSSSVVAVWCRRLALTYLLVLFVFALHLAGWLVMADDITGFSDGFFDQFVKGKVYLAFGEEKFWAFAPTTWQSLLTQNIVFHLKPMALSAVIGSVWWFTLAQSEKSYISHFVSCCGVLFLPCLIGMLFLAINPLPVHQSGPVLALIIYPVLYLTLPMIAFLKRLKPALHAW